MIPLCSACGRQSGMSAKKVRELAQGRNLNFGKFQPTIFWGFDIKPSKSPKSKPRTVQFSGKMRDNCTRTFPQDMFADRSREIKMRKRGQGSVHRQASAMRCKIEAGFGVYYYTSDLA